MSTFESLQPGHPFYPSTLFVPDYVPSIYTPSEILWTVGAFNAASVLAIQVWLEKNRAPAPPTIRERVRVGWFATCVILHIAELYISLAYPTASSLASSTSFIPSLLKLYSPADSRLISYTPPIPGLTKMTTTLVLPLCILSLYGLFTNNFLLELLASIISSAMYIAGDVMYFTGTLNAEWTVGGRGSWFWGGLIGANLPWVVVPIWLIWDGYRRVARVLMVAKAKTGSSKRRVEW